MKRKSLLIFDLPISNLEEKKLRISKEIFSDNRKIKVSIDRKTVVIYEEDSKDAVSER